MGAVSAASGESGRCGGGGGGRRCGRGSASGWWGSVCHFPGNRRAVERYRGGSLCCFFLN